MHNQNIQKLRFLYMHHLNIFILIFIDTELSEFRVSGVGPVFSGLPSLNDKKIKLIKMPYGRISINIFVTPLSSSILEIISFSNFWLLIAS